MSLHTPAHKQISNSSTSDMFRKGAEDWTAWVKTTAAKESAPATQPSKGSPATEDPLQVVADSDSRSSIWGMHLG